MPENLMKEAYEVNKDNLIYDYLRLIDAKNVMVQLPQGSGTLKRGQIIDFDENKYQVHKAGGTANCIVATDVSYSEEETEAAVSVYISGDFSMDACISDAAVESQDIESLRSSGIILK